MSNQKQRREFLREYIIACLRDSVLSWSDLTSAAAVDKIFGVVSKDAKEILRELLRTGVGGLARLGVMKLAQLAEDLTAGRRKGGV